MTRVFYVVLYIGLLLFVFFGLPDKIIYHKLSDLLSWLPFILLFIFQPLLVYKICKIFDINNQYSIGIAALSVLISGPTYGIYLGTQQNKELSQYGKQTTGIVCKKWETLKYQKHYEWLLRCKFVVNGTNYSSFSVQDKKNLFHIGDTLHIMYSERNPENCVVVELNGK